ncbi:MAG: glycosyltransferase family 39 protein [Desulfomonilaceae bacterium]
MNIEPSNWKHQNRDLFLWLGLTLVFVWRFLLSAYVNLIPDECSYWAWSRRLDWSYFDNSGMVAYLIRISTELFGYSTPFSVRFPFLLLSFLSSAFIYSCSLNLFGDRRIALVTVFVFNITPVSILGATAAIHDNALIFFTILTIWFLSKFLSDRRSVWLYLSGIAIGLSMLSKYTGAISLLCALIFIIWLKDLRPLLLSRSPWLAAVLAMSLTIPIIYWNWRHDWASLNHILFIGSGAVALSRRIEDGIGFNIAQFFLISPQIYIFVVLATMTALWNNLRRPSANQVLCICFGIPLFLFAAQSFRGHVEANWSMPGYIGPFMIAVWSFYGSEEGALNWVSKPWSQKFVKYSLVWSLLIVSTVVLHTWIGIIPASWERSISKADRIIWETRGWDKLGQHVSEFIGKGEILAADSYQLCALLEFNTPGQPQVRYLAPWERPTQFDIWHRSFDDLKGRDIIFVSPKPLLPSSDAFTTIYESFSSVEQLPVYHVIYHGVSIREIFIYRCRAFNPEHPRKLGPRSLFYKDYHL